MTLESFPKQPTNRIREAGPPGLEIFAILLQSWNPGAIEEHTAGEYRTREASWAVCYPIALWYETVHPITNSQQQLKAQPIQHTMQTILTIPLQSGIPLQSQRNSWTKRPGNIEPGRELALQHYKYHTSSISALHHRIGGSQTYKSLTRYKKVVCTVFINRPLLKTQTTSQYPNHARPSLPTVAINTQS